MSFINQKGVDPMHEPNRKIKAVRVFNDKTQTEIAAVLGISLKSYGLKENNQQDFTESEIDKLLSYFGKKYEELF